MRSLLFVFFALSVCAQAAREVRLRLLAFDNMTIPADCFAFDPAAPPGAAGTPAPIKGYLNHEVVKVTVTTGDLTFSKSADVANLNKPEFQLGKVKLPNTGSRFMLIFLPNGDQGFRVMPLDDSVREFPLGAYRFVSLSRLPVKVTLEDKAYEFKPGQSSLVENPPVQANNHSAMYAYSFVDGKWARIGAGLWPAQGKKRSVQIFWDNPSSKNTELRGFRDISPPGPGDEIAPDQS
ncbi:MAG: hypothetical protein EOP88_08160 [Verrucomicrobiaceae bacterium]|nr:MAG: hypothetical protein EOP88_08160 [Verrucomicrobiaceae bacterium]